MSQNETLEQFLDQPIGTFLTILFGREANYVSAVYRKVAPNAWIPHEEWANQDPELYTATEVVYAMCQGRLIVKWSLS